MNTCKTCKYWEPRREYENGHSLRLGKCLAAKMLFDATEWTKDSDGLVLKAEFKDRKFFVQDGSDYIADLLTLPTFGCIAHEVA